MQSSLSNIRFAGDVQIIEVQINSLNGQIANVTAQVELIEIFEDLFSPFITVSIVMRESIDYINLFPFVEMNKPTPYRLLLTNLPPLAR